MTIEQVAALAMAFPETSESERYGKRSWAVRGKTFAWERPFSKADVKRFGTAAPPDGTILAITVADLNEKEAILAAHSGPFFTIPHFDGYAAVLVQLDTVAEKALRDVLVDGWLACAPPALARDFLEATKD